MVVPFMTVDLAAALGLANTIRGAQQSSNPPRLEVAPRQLLGWLTGARVTLHFGHSA